MAAINPVTQEQLQSVINGSVPPLEATHALSADTATNADNADNADSADVAVYAKALGTVALGADNRGIYLGTGGEPLAMSATVGSSSLPTYLAGGQVAVCSTTLGVDITGNAYSADHATEAMRAANATKADALNLDAAAGSDTTFVYFPAGMSKPTESTATVGNNKLPMYMEEGVLKACDSTLGVSISGNAATATSANSAANAENADYATEAGSAETAAKADTATTAKTASKLGEIDVGSYQQGIYLDGGTATAMSCSVGNSGVPVYFLGGVPTEITKLSIDTSGNALTATTAESATSATEDALGNNIAATYVSSLAIDYDETDYVITITAKNANGDTIASKAIDLPIESMIVDAAYDSETGTLTLKLQNGTTLDGIDLSDLVSGLASTSDITSGAITAAKATNADYAAGIGSSTTSVGSSTNPVYVTNGAVTASSSTVGGEAVPMCLIDGVFTECGDTLDVDISGKAATAGKADSATTATNADYATAAGTATSAGNASTATNADYATEAGTANVATYIGSETSSVGSNTQFTYISNGKPTASTANVGSTAKPAYVINGVISETSDILDVSITGNAATATSATSATKATQDADGNVIADTYATKEELEDVKDAATSGGLGVNTGSLTIPATWTDSSSSYTVTVTDVENVYGSSFLQIFPEADSAEEYTRCFVRASSTGSNTITFIANSAPSKALNMNYMVCNA